MHRFSLNSHTSCERNAHPRSALLRFTAVHECIKEGTLVSHEHSRRVTLEHSPPIHDQYTVTVHDSIKSARKSATITSYSGDNDAFPTNLRSTKKRKTTSAKIAISYPRLTREEMTSVLVTFILGKIPTLPRQSNSLN